MALINDIYMIVALLLCGVFSVITINYYDNPDAGVWDKELPQDLTELEKPYKLVYKLSIASASAVGLIVLLMLLKYSGIQLKFLSALLVFSVIVIILVSLVQIYYAVEIATFEIRAREGRAFGSTFLMGASPLVSCISGLALIPSLVVLLKQLRK